MLVDTVWANGVWANVWMQVWAAAGTAPPTLILSHGVHSLIDSSAGVSSQITESLGIESSISETIGATR